VRENEKVAPLWVVIESIAGIGPDALGEKMIAIEPAEPAAMVEGAFTV